MKPHIIVTVAATLVLAAIANTLWAQEQTRVPSSVGSDGTSVRELKACSRELPLEGPSKVEHVSHDSRGLVVRALANANCGPVVPVEPEATVDVDQVRISWFWYLPPDQSPLRCLCAKRLEFVVPHAKGVERPRVLLSHSDWRKRELGE